VSQYDLYHRICLCVECSPVAFWILVWRGL